MSPKRTILVFSTGLLAAILILAALRLHARWTAQDAVSQIFSPSSDPQTILAEIADAEESFSAFETFIEEEVERAQARIDEASDISAKRSEKQYIKDQLETLDSARKSYEERLDQLNSRLPTGK